MNTDQLVQQIVENPQLLKEHTLQLEELPTDEAVALVPDLVQAFHEHKLWPQDSACLIAVCRPTDEQLLELLRDDRQRSQKLGLHIVALLIGTPHFQQHAHADLAQSVLLLLQTEAFRPKRKHLMPLEKWAKSRSVQADNSPTQK